MRKCSDLIYTTEKNIPAERGVPADSPTWWGGGGGGGAGPPR